MSNQDYIPIIGLEIHVELKTKSKMFCGCDANYFGAKPNTHCCPVCLGLPGALPVPNRKAVEWCVSLGLALGCEIPLFSKFDRKNYFYPDLPKGYQISQYDKPFAINGLLKLKTQNSKLKTSEVKEVRIRRVHMEEDTGKLVHATVDGEKCTLIDFNRCGVPLVEIVTEPDIRSSEEAREFLKKIYQIIRYLEISDADMEKGSMRLEPNISLLKISKSKHQIPNKFQSAGWRTNSKFQKDTDILPKYKVEVKNINSFSFAKKAIDYEIERQVKILNSGEIPKQETRGWDEKKGVTYPQRSKEEAHDYRYFPEPDIPPICWERKYIENLKNSLPELPEAIIDRFIRFYHLSRQEAQLITAEKNSTVFFEKCAETAGNNKTYEALNPKKIASFIINQKSGQGILDVRTLLERIMESVQKINTDTAQLAEAADRVIRQNARAVEDYRKGKTQVMMFLIGQIMREMKGKADPNVIRQYLESKINKE